MSTSPPGWQPDPRGRHEYRYWDGTQWTDHVSDKGEMSTDPVADTSPATEVQPAAAAPEPAAAAPEPAAAAPDPAAAAAPQPAAPEPEPQATVARSTQPASSGGPPPASSSVPASSGAAEPSAAGSAKATAQQALEAKSPDLAVLLSVIAPGSGHFYLGVEPAKRNIAIGLLVATVAAVVISTFGFIPFVIGLALWAGAAFYAVNDLRGGSVAGLENASIPKQFVGLLLIAGGALLIIALILPWYKVKASSGGFSQSESGNAFDALDWEPFVLIITGAVSILAGLASMGIGVPADKLPPWLPTVVAILGAVSLAVVVFRMFITGAPDTPDGIDVSIGRMPGILLAADAAIVLVMANLSVLKSLKK